VTRASFHSVFAVFKAPFLLEVCALLRVTEKRVRSRVSRALS
jgi:hypothetical protein